MAQPTSRKQFKETVLRKIGAPVIQINVSDEQIEDRIDEALSFFADYHYNGSEHVYLKHQLTEQNVEDGYIDISDIADNILGVPRVFDMGSSLFSGSGMFNVTYQFVLNNVQDIAGFGLQNYYMSMQHIAFMQEILVGKPLIRYNKHVNRLTIDKTKSTLIAGEYIIIEAYLMIDGSEFTSLWSDRWLQNYAAVLIQEQWGKNITKYTGAQLVGGVQFNGEQILQTATEERKKMEEDAINGLQPLVHNFIG